MDKVTGFELPAINMGRAKKFFKKAFGWKVEPHMKDYYHAMTVAMDKNWVPKEKGAVNGGIFKKGSKTDKAMIVIDVKSIDKTIKAVRAAGGKLITKKTQAGEWGWWAEVKDTEGNGIELWEEM